MAEEEEVNPKARMARPFRRAANFAQSLNSSVCCILMRICWPLASLFWHILQCSVVRFFSLQAYPLAKDAVDIVLLFGDQVLVRYQYQFFLLCSIQKGNRRAAELIQVTSGILHMMGLKGYPKKSQGFLDGHVA